MRTETAYTAPKWKAPVKKAPTDKTPTIDKGERDTVSGGMYQDLGDKQTTVKVGDAELAFSTPSWVRRAGQIANKAAQYAAQNAPNLIPGGGVAGAAVRAAAGLAANTDWTNNRNLASFRMPNWNGSASVTIPERMGIGPLQMTRPNTTKYTLNSPLNGQWVNVANPLYEQRASGRSTPSLLSRTGESAGISVNRQPGMTTGTFFSGGTRTGGTGGAADQPQPTPYDFMADYKAQIAKRNANPTAYLNYINQYARPTTTSGGGSGGGGGGFGTSYGGWGSGSGSGYNSSYVPNWLLNLYSWNFKG